MDMENIDKKENILEAAREVFFRKSFYEATMDDIAQLSGVKKPTIYYYFPSKIDLASQLMEENVKKIFKKTSEIISTTNNVKQRIKMKIRKKQKETGDLFGEVILSSGKKVSGDLFLYSVIAALGRAIFENVSQGRKPKKQDLLAIGDIFIASVK